MLGPLENNSVSLPSLLPWRNVNMYTSRQVHNAHSIVFNSKIETVSSDRRMATEVVYPSSEYHSAVKVNEL